MSKLPHLIRAGPSQLHTFLKMEIGEPAELSSNKERDADLIENCPSEARVHDGKSEWPGRGTFTFTIASQTSSETKFAKRSHFQPF